MPPQARSERTTQNHVIALFTDSSHPDCLGHGYLDSWHDRPDNRCIETDLLQANHFTLAEQTAIAAARTWTPNLPPWNSGGTRPACSNRA